MLLPRFKDEFSDYKFEVIDVLEDILERNLALRASLFSRACLRYAQHILGNRQNPRDFFLRFADAWDAVRLWSLRNASPETTAFTFQTQSLFDASHPDIPHFLYTDHTYLANARYPNRAKPLPVTARWMEREDALYKNANINFTSSNFAATSISEDYGIPDDRVNCVFSGINIPMPVQVKSFGEKLKRILFVGVDWDRKGGPFLLKAFREVRQHIKDAELWIIGCNPDISEEGVKVYGRIPTSEVCRFYEEADVFCLPSKYEPSATVLVEAAAYGLPVVATAVGGSVERVEDGKTGLLVPPSDEKALAAALLEILNHPDKAASFGRAGRQMVESRFTWEHVARRMRVQITERIGNGLETDE